MGEALIMYEIGVKIFLFHFVFLDLFCIEPRMVFESICNVGYDLWYMR